MSLEVKPEKPSSVIKKPAKFLKALKNTAEFGAGVIVSDAIKSVTPSQVPDTAQDVIHLIGGTLGAAATARMSKDAANVIGGIAVGGGRNLVKKAMDWLKSKFGGKTTVPTSGFTPGTQSSLPAGDSDYVF